jgi:prepilin-type N-terminal cleavage/methylation domain-containing protein
MTFSKLKTMKKDRGFTIVELLIVIVVIAILAAIVIVAYNGVQNRAKTSAAASTAQTVQQKLEAYNAEVGNYPATWSLMTADSTKSYFVSGVTLKASGNPASTDSTTTFSLYSCTGGGDKVTYYDTTAAGIASVYVGPATAACTGASATQIAS